MYKIYKVLVVIVMALLMVSSVSAAPSSQRPSHRDERQSTNITRNLIITQVIIDMTTVIVRVMTLMTIMRHRMISS